jgi:hypothetical protein
VAHRIDLDDQAEVQLFDLAKMDQPIENDLPILVSREIVVGDEEPRDSLDHVGAHDVLDIVRRTSS